LSKVITLGFKHPGSALYFISSSGMAVMHAATEKGLVLSASAVGSDGPLGAAARMAFAADNDFGADFTGVQAFGDESGGWLLEAADSEGFEHMAESKLPRVAWRRVGTTTVADLEGGVDLAAGGASWDLDELRTAWEKPLAEIYG